MTSASAGESWGLRVRGAVDPWLMTKAAATVAVLLLLATLARLERRRRTLSLQFKSYKVRNWHPLGNLGLLGVRSMLRMGDAFLDSFTQLGLSLQLIFPGEKITLVWLMYQPVVICLKPEAAEEMMTGTKMMKKSWNYNFFRPWLKNGLLVNNDADYKSRRKLLTPSFHSDILKSFIPIFCEKSAGLVQALRSELDKDFSDVLLPIKLCSLDIIMETIFGVESHAQANKECQYVESIDVVTHLTFKRILNFTQWLDFPFFAFTKAGRALKANIKILTDFTKKVISEKKERLLKGETDAQEGKRKVFMDLLLQHHMDSKILTEDNIMEEVDTFTFGGHDTVSVSMMWCLYLLGLHREAQEKIWEELERIFQDDRERPATLDDINDMIYIDCVLKESQRIYPAVPVIAREVVEDMTMCGKPVPRGAICAIPIALMHHDEEVFPESVKFDPTRFLPEQAAGRHPFSFLPFSAGLRSCVGQRFAAMETKVILSTLCRHYVFESLDPQDRTVPVPGVLLHPRAPLRIRIRPRTF